MSLVLLLGISAWAQTPVAVSVYEDCSKSGKTYDVRPATAVNNISADSDTAVRKVFRDGQVYILRNGKTYTTTGVEVK